jgi:hypothetical protein
VVASVTVGTPHLVGSIRRSRQHNIILQSRSSSSVLGRENVESKQNLVEVVNRLSVKIDSYDKRITALGSDISKV